MHRTLTRVSCEGQSTIWKSKGSCTLPVISDCSWESIQVVFNASQWLLVSMTQICHEFALRKRFVFDFRIFVCTWKYIGPSPKHNPWGRRSKFAHVPVFEHYRITIILDDRDDTQIPHGHLSYCGHTARPQKTTVDDFHRSSIVPFGSNTTTRLY